MPRRAMTPCRGRCGARVEGGGYCAACAGRGRGSATRKSAAKRGYDAGWRKDRVAYFARHPFCADPFGVHGDLLVLATQLDHKIPHKGDPVKFADPKNRQGLCHSCHSRKTATEDGGFGR